MGLESRWSEVDWVAFDTETSGKYPIDSEICEIAAVRWSKGQIVGKFESFVKVSKPMSAEVIAIHNITNEMLVGAPEMKDVLPKFNDFISNAYLIAHHSPFDLGFLAVDYEKYRLPFPTNPVFCSSLISRAVITESPDHRMKTLVQHLNLPVRTAHRALADAESCMDLAIKCFERMGMPTLANIQDRQGRKLEWPDFAVSRLKSDQRYRSMIEALEQKQDVQIEYQGGSNPGQPRTITPIGIVMSPGQDFLVAKSYDDTPPKRFYLNKIKASRS